MCAEFCWQGERQAEREDRVAERRGREKEEETGGATVGQGGK